MGRGKSKYLLIDTETCGSMSMPLVYDFGYIVTDKEGTIYKSSEYIVTEVYNNHEAMKGCFYEDKLPLYDEKLKYGLLTQKNFVDILAEVTKTIKEYNIKGVCAYNLSFDLRALNTTTQWLTRGFAWEFFDDKLKKLDIYHMACCSVCNSTGYIKFCIENKLETKSGLLPTNAETVYKYLTNNEEYEEEHTALADVLIENDIMAYCWNKTTKEQKEIKHFPFRIPQEKYKTIKESM